MKNSSTTLKPFFRFVADYREIIGAIVAFAAAPPLVSFLFAIGPPWPLRETVAAYTSVTALVTLMLGFGLWETISEKKLRSLLKRLAPLTFGALALYIILSPFLVRNAPDYRHQEAGGFIVLPDVQRVIDETPGMTLQKAFKSAEYKPFAVWVGWTVQTSRLLLLLSWLSFFASLSFLTGVFVMLQNKRRLSRERAALKASQKSQGNGDSKEKVA